MGERWRDVAEQVRNWGRWGPDDQIGTLNYITPDKIARACGSASQGRSIPLGVPFDAYGPQGSSGFRRNPIHLMSVDGGDANLAATLAGWGGPTEENLVRMYAGGPMRFNDDFITMPLQAATQWDGLSHVYYDDQLYNGYPASSVTSFGATKNGVEQVAQRAGVVGRGVLLDVARHGKLQHLEPHTVISPELLDEVAAAQGVEVGEGDIVVVRTGWWTAFEHHRDPDAWLVDSPGLSWRCARWLHAHRVAAVALDNPAVEVMPPEEDVLLLLHCLAIRDMGLTLGEIWNLEKLSADCAEDQVYQFLLTAPALNVPGGVGTPISPIAIK
ncbi:MAG TPA: cyclase family protein [Pseudonocardia sp.]